jgi:hypothetical protein
MEAEPTGGEPPHLSRPAQRGVEKPRKSEDRLGGSLPEEVRGKPPPLHPIFERLSQALAKQKAENPDPPKPLAEPLDPAELDRREQKRVSERERKRQWRQKYPERHRQNVARWQRSEKGRTYKAAWMRKYREKQKHSENA